MRPNSWLIGLMILAGCGGLSNAQSDAEWDRVRSEAESYYELALLQIEQGKFLEGVKNAKSIFSLPFPAERHELLFDSAKEISDALIHHSQHELALEVLDSCFEAVSQDGILSKLHKEKAYIYKKMGRDEEAMRHFEKSIELSKKPLF